MKSIEYIKYNSYRQKKFCVGTVIYNENGKKYSKKFALNSLAAEHIKNMSKNYTELLSLYNGLIPLKGELDNDSIVFDYIDGQSLGNIVIEQLLNMDKDEYLNYFSELVSNLFHVNFVTEKFEISDEFISVFHDISVPEDLTCAIGLNIDMSFSNIFFVEGKYISIDYEWVCDFSIPINFSIYRSVYYLYMEQSKIFKENNIDLNDLLSACGITNTEESVYDKMEKAFQSFVFGEEAYNKRYFKNNDTIGLNDLIARDKDEQQHIINLDEEVELLREKNKSLEEEKIEFEKNIKNLADNNDIMKFDLHQKEAEIERLNVEISQLRQHIVGLDTYRQTWEYYYRKPIVQVAKYPYRFARKVYDGTVGKMKNDSKNQSDNVNSSSKKEKLIIPHYENPLVSIIMPAYNQFDYTYECVKSIILFTPGIPYEIILADDCSTDKTKKIENYIEGLVHIRNKQNLRFLKNCNNAAKEAKGNYILFLNNDTRVTEEWLSSLVNLIESDDNIGMVGSKLIYPDGRLQEAGGIIWKDASAWNYGNGQDPEAPEFNYVRDVDYISGAAIMIKASLWKELGGFDERFSPAYCEDSDLAFQVRKAGYRVVYQPKSVVIHYEGVSNGTDTSTGQKRYQVINNEKLKDKWQHELNDHYENGTHVIRAKDRCFSGKKMILFIDHYVPHFDQDAGSRTVFQYLKLFLAKGYDVKFIGDNYYKHEPYTTVLNQMGIEVLHGPWYAQHIFEWLEDNEEDIDYIFMNRPHITEKYIDFVKEKMHAKIIYYGHDLHFLRLTREYEMTGDEYKRMEAVKLKKSEFEIFNKADVIYYPSYVEVDMIHSVNPDLYAKAIVPYVFDTFTDYNRKSSENLGILFVGGFAHAPNVDAVEWFIKEIYPTIREKNIPFIIAGSHPPDSIVNLADDMINVKGYVSDEELHKLYHTCKMVVVPLRYGAGIKGKVVEAIYQGIPVVTTSVGAEGIEKAESILAIEDDAQLFADKVIELYSDDEKLDIISGKMQEYIKKYNSVEAAWNIISEDF